MAPPVFAPIGFAPLFVILVLFQSARLRERAPRGSTLLQVKGDA